jgi:hypothetical protein
MNPDAVPKLNPAAYDAISADFNARAKLRAGLDYGSRMNTRGPLRHESAGHKTPGPSLQRPKFLTHKARAFFNQTPEQIQIKQDFVLFQKADGPARWLTARMGRAQVSD